MRLTEKTANATRRSIVNPKKAPAQRPSPHDALLKDPERFMSLPFEERGILLRRDEAWREMEARLLSLGGTRLAYMPDPHAADVVAAGKIYSPARRQMVRGEPNGCHGNSAALWLRRRPEVTLVTGWALSDDGCWRQHSWAWRKAGHVWIDTTEHRLFGLGIELDGARGLKFAMSNLPPDRFCSLLKGAVDADPALMAEFQAMVDTARRSMAANQGSEKSRRRAAA